MRASLAVIAFLFAVPTQAQWIEAPGTGWVEVQAAHHRTDTRFDPSGDVVPLFNEDSRSVTTTLRLSGAVGVVRGVDVWADAAVHHLQFDDATRERTSTGLGDVRLFLRMGPGLLGVDDLPLAAAVRGGVKLPGNDFPVDAEIIPLTDGQRDYEILVEVGKSLHPLPVYVQAWAGYRWRTVNTAIDRKPGDERFFFVAAGGQGPENLPGGDRLSWKLAVDGLFGLAPERRFASFTVPLPNDARELVQVLPSLGVDAGPGTVELGARFPLHGQNLPAGPTLTLGYFWTWE
jgi:hypothetical protein